MDRDFWRKRYREKQWGWDLGQVSPPIKTYVDGLIDKNLRILIPGAGQGHEAAYLWQTGFRQTYICEWAPEAVQLFKTLQPHFPDKHIFIENFFELDIQVDLILEQTFFCAINPALRPAYAEKCAELLAPKGRVAGLLFASPFDKPGPPFGGTKEEYLRYFTPHFDILYMEICPNSVKPRQGNELFFELQKTQA